MRKYLLLIMTAVMFTACEEDPILTGTPATDSSEYEVANQTFGYLKSSLSARNEVYAEAWSDTTFNIVFGLTKITGTDVHASVAVDSSLVKAYNAANGTSYQKFPIEQVTLSNNGYITIPKWKHESVITMALEKGALEAKLLAAESTYILPVVVNENQTSVQINATSKIIYFIIRIKQRPVDYLNTDHRDFTAVEKGIRTLCYVEVNDANPLNIGNYVLANNGKPFFDIMVVFAANIKYNAVQGVYLYFNPNVAHILNNKEKYLVPLQEKGIKIILGLLGDHDGVGLANLTGSVLTKFLADCNEVLAKYNLDGLDFDDEWSDYSTSFGFPAASSTNYGNLMVAARDAMPDKLLTYFEYGNRPGTGLYNGKYIREVIDYSMYAMYGSSGATGISMPNAKYSPSATWINNRTPTSLTSTATTIKSGYGLMFFYDLRDGNDVPYLSVASNILFGEPVIMEMAPYAKDW